MASAKSFTEFEVWQLSSKLQQKIYTLIEKPPLSRDFALKDQMNRSCGSIPDNIAEGFGRAGRNEFIQFLSYSRASASELQSQITRCYQRKYIDEETYLELNELVDKTGRKLGAFIKYLNSTPIKGEKFKNRVPTEDAENTSTHNKGDIKKDTPIKTKPNKKPQTQIETKGGIIKEIPNVFEPNEKRETDANIKVGVSNERETIVHTNKAAKPLGAYPHARKVGHLLFLSGIGSRRAADNSIPGLKLDTDGKILQYDIAAETHQCFANVKAVLEASGSSWDKIVDVTVFLTNMKTDFPIYNKIYGEYFSGVQACRTTVEVKSLPTPIAIELKVIAVI